jgi:5,10-methylenetetrahydromethanopterin reductase
MADQRSLGRKRGGLKRIGLGFVAQPYSIKDIISAARAAERSEFDSVWITEDIWTGRDAISILTSLAVSTENVGLGTAVINIYTRHPVLTAQTFNAISEIAPNRLILGIGSGMTWKPLIEAQGRKLHPLRDMRQSILTIRGLWSGKEIIWNEQKLSLAVTRKCFKGAIAPIDKPIPIYMGAVGPRMTELAGEIAEGLILELAVRREDIPVRLRQLAMGARRAGKDTSSHEIVGLVLTSVSRNGDIHPNALGYAVKTVATMSDTALEKCDFDPGLVRRIRTAYLEGDCQQAFRLISPDMISTFLAAGTQDECLLFIEDLVEAGIGMPVLIPFGGDLNSVIEIGAEFLRRNN